MELTTSEIVVVPNTTDPYADDYQCPKCGNTDWSFGSWPSCKGNPEDHFPRRGRRLGEKALTTIYELPDGSIFNPTGPNAPIPKNAKRVEFRTIQEVDHYFNQVNKVRGEIADYHIERDKEQWNEHMRQVREEMNSRGTRDNPGLFEMSPMGRDMARLAMEQYSNYNPRRSQDSFIEAQYYDRNSGRED